MKMPFASLLSIPRIFEIRGAGSLDESKRSIPPLKGSRGSLFEIKGREIEG